MNSKDSVRGVSEEDLFMESYYDSQEAEGINFGDEEEEAPRVMSVRLETRNEDTDNEDNEEERRINCITNFEGRAVYAIRELDLEEDSIRIPK